MKPNPEKQSTEIKINGYIYDWLTCANQHRLVFLFGGSSAGKSFTFKQWIILEKILKEKNKIYGFFRKTTPAAKKSVRREIVGFLKDLQIPFTENKTEGEILVQKTNSLIIYGGVDDPEKYKSVAFNYIWLEEITQFTEDDLNRLMIACRAISLDGKINQMFGLWNPISKTHWIFKRFFESRESIKREPYHVLKVTYRNNPFLTKDDIAVLENNPDKHYRDVYRDGNWGSLDENNIVIPARLFYEANENVIDVPAGGLAIGVDVARFGDDLSVIYFRKGLKFYDPISYDKSRTTTISERIIGIIKDFTGKHGKKLPVVVNIDVTGIGSGVVDELVVWARKNLDLNVRINEIEFGGKAQDQDRFANVASEMYFNAKEILEENYVDFCGHDVTINEASARVYMFDNNSRYKIESKDNFKKRIEDSSPDYADAFCLCLYDAGKTKSWKDVF